jgi:hypothetical protein
MFVDIHATVDRPMAIASRLADLAVIVLATLGLFCVVEGCASVIYVCGQLASAPRLIPEHRYVEYDAELGWVSRPNWFVPDLYGRGRSLRTNAQRFRSDYDFTVAVPAGRARVVCSGDSFTLGHGVSGDQAWCPQLAADEPRLETVNMGQGGYGVDQAYLWYVRDGLKLDHHAQVFAFIAHDLLRMTWTRFAGISKPLLKVVDGRIVATNTPLSTLSTRFPRAAQNAHYLLELHTLELLGAGRAPAPNVAEERALALRILERLAEIHRQRQSDLLVVFLPVRGDYDGDPDDAAAWRAFFASELGRRGIPYLDLVAEFKKLRPEEVPPLFNPGGHYGAAGHRWVARQVAPVLRALPVVARRLDERGR